MNVESKLSGAIEMSCALSVLKHIGLVFLLLLRVVVGTGALMGAGFGTAWVFGWTETPLPTLGFCALYMILGMGTAAGIAECRG